jgi:hypothetical protein
MEWGQYLQRLRSLDGSEARDLRQVVAAVLGYGRACCRSDRAHH